MSIKEFESQSKSKIESIFILLLHFAIAIVITHELSRPQSTNLLFVIARKFELQQ